MNQIALLDTGEDNKKPNRKRKEMPVCEEEKEEWLKRYKPLETTRCIELKKRTSIEWLKTNEKEYLSYLTEHFERRSVLMLLSIGTSVTIGNDMEEFIDKAMHTFDWLGLVMDEALLQEVVWYLSVKKGMDDELAELDLNWSTLFYFDTPDHPFEKYLIKQGF
jgi:hypothetical protein